MVLGLMLVVVLWSLSRTSVWRGQQLRNRYSLEQDVLGTEQFEQGHFRCFYPTGAAEEARQLSAELNRFVAALVAEFGQELSIRPRKPITSVYLFSDIEQLRGEFRRTFAGSIDNNGGFYNPRYGEIVVVVGENLLASACHETAHMILDRWIEDRSGAWSPWLGEGLATYLERVDEVDGELQWGVLDARLLKDGKELIADGQWMPVARLTGARQAQFTGADNADYYVQSYLLLHFLRHADGGRYRDAFQRYYDAERKGKQTGKPGLQLARLIGIPPEELDRRVQAYVKGLGN